MKGFSKSLMWFFMGVLFLGICTAACTAAYFWHIWSSNLPVIDSVKEYRPFLITEILSHKGEVIGRFWEEKRIVVPVKQLPGHLIQAFVAAEDARFFEHKGVDVISVIRAFLKNYIAGRIEQGGSTITQQITRSLLLKSTEKTYRRKAREALLSLQLEKELTKDQILFVYVNEIYLGHGAYGVEAAAHTYFGKPARDLTLAESALLAGLPQAPARYSPVSHFDRARNRQEYVLRQMLKEGYITEKQFRNALEVQLSIRRKPKNDFTKASYFTEYVRRYLLEKYGRDILYRGGLTVYTTVNLRMQHIAEKALKKGLAELDKREGYRGPLRHLSPGEIDGFLERAAEKLLAAPPRTGSTVEGVVVYVDDKKREVIVRIGGDMGRLPLTEMEWARRPNPEIAYHAARVRRPSLVLRKGDVILLRILKERPSRPSPAEKGGGQGLVWEVSLEQAPVVQGALFSMDKAGEVKAMVGGRDFASSQFNRAIQSRRQPGSAFKPIIYAAALDWGMTPADIIVDAPFVAEQGPNMELWKPRNFKEEFLGPTLIRTALTKSKNVITVKILKKIGAKYAIQYARTMGIESPLSPYLSLALGASGVSLIELTKAYSVFANGGLLVKPIFVKRVVDRQGKILEENGFEAREAISRETAYVMTDLLKAVIKEGTGWRIKALKRPVAGKTGTTNNLWDAWFLGFTPGLVTGVWAGYDDRKPMGKEETGSRAASPIWLYFMSEVLKDRAIEKFPVPKGVVFSRIDAHTGLLADPDSEKTVLQAFKKGTKPTVYTTESSSELAGRFFQMDMEYAQ
ncbi:MAG: PBP1A family penicillin-binding protein [Deltaproteobacteria bacterium]|nr:PBP1A family penicillin-binding protein [Deltaproteobacteria bacterium]